MKIMLTWQLHQGRLMEALELFTNMKPDEEDVLMGSVQLIGRWHDPVRGRGAAIYEADSAEDVAAYALQWNDKMDLDISVVLDDKETRALGRRMANA
jgi:hypothetical protein